MSSDQKDLHDMEVRVQIPFLVVALMFSFWMKYS